jgi:hypothetical protein
MGIRSRREVRNHPSKKIPLPPSSPCSLILGVIETGILWAIVRVWRCVAVTRWVYEKRGNERGESCSWVSVLFFLIATGAAYILYYTATITRNLISDKLRVYTEQKTDIFAYVCLCCCCVYLCLWPSRKTARGLVDRVI